MIQATTSLTTHILHEQAPHPEATGEFSTMMVQIALAGRKIARDLSHSGLIDIVGTTGEKNIQGEEVQKLDQRANDTFVEVFEGSEVVRTVVSEEMDHPRPVAGAKRPGNYAVFVDPLDGSSNIDVDAPLGSIFSIHRLSSAGSGSADQDLLKSGGEQIAAGYLLYGSSTVLVYTCGAGVHQFILDPEIEEFVLSARNIQMPVRGKLYSVNEGNYHKWSTGMKRYIDELKVLDSAMGRPYSSRYTGCLVGDVHRILLKGGIYLYPGETKKPEGKLRLMYEAAPLSFIAAQSGGIGSAGSERIHSIQPKSLHQRVPLFIGSREDVERAEQALRA